MQTPEWSPRARGRLAVTLLLGLTGTIYVWGLDHSPVYFGGDEAHFAVHGYAIAQDGRNLDGSVMPLFINLFDPLGDPYPNDLKTRWYQPMLFYLEALALTILPLTEVSVRLPIALIAGWLSPWLMYVVAARLVKSRAIAACAAIMLAMSPSHLLLGRQALDYILPLPFVLGWLWCLAVFIEGGGVWFALAGGLLLGVGFYSYIAAWVFMPLCLLLGWAAYVRTGRPDWARASIAAGIGFALPLVPLVPWFISHPQMLRDTFARYQDEIVGPLAFGPLGAKLFDYLGFFNPWFLFVTGGPVPTTSTGRAGVFLVAVAALLPVGAYDLLRRWKAVDIGMVLLAGLLLSPIPATLVSEPRMIQRGLFILPFGILIAAFGLARLWRSPATVVRGIALLLLAAVPAQFAMVYRDYFTHYKLRSAFYYDSVSFKDVAEYLIAAEVAGSVPGVYLSVELDDAGSKWRFYTTKHGKEDLLQRTRYFEGSGTDLAGAAPGSLLVMYPHARGLAALLDTKQWSVARTVLDVDKRAAATILRRIS